MWPRYWKDIYFVKATVIGTRKRMDVIGLGGIGKTYFTKHLAGHLGTVSPRKGNQDRTISSEWTQVFESVMRGVGRKFASTGLTWERKVDKLWHLGNVFELEKKSLQSPPSSLVVNNESILRHRLTWFVDTASTQPDLIKNLLNDRLVLICEAKDPVERSLRGRTNRGDAVDYGAKSQESLSKSVQKTRDSASILNSLGVPTLVVSLDHPVRENVSRVAKFLEQNQVTSRRIRKWAKRSH